MTEVRSHGKPHLSINGRRWLFWLVAFIVFLIFLYLIRSILLPFVLGMATAYFLDPAADKLESLGISRTMATLIMTGCFFFTVIMLGIVIVPVIAHQLADLIDALPSFMAEYERKYSQQFERWTGAIPSSRLESLGTAVDGFSGALVKLLGNFFTGVLLSGIAILNVLSLFLITPVVAFYLLRDWDTIVIHFDKLLPRRSADTIREQLRIIDRTLAGFVRGQSMVCLLMGAFYAIGLSIVGLQFGIVIGLLTGLLLILPYAGFALSFAAAMGVAIFQFESWEPIAGVLGVYLVGQILESAFITPKLVGDRVGLHPVWIIFGMLAGAALFGFVGVLIAVPATAVIGVLSRFAVQRYLESGYYQSGPPAAPGK